MKKVLMVLLLLLAANVVASAALIPDLLGVFAGPLPGQFTWEYLVTLAPGAKLEPGLGTNFLTLYDFNGFVGFGAVPAGWIPSSAATGLTPADVLPDDDPAVLNVSFTYIGPTVIGPASFAPFQVISIFDLPTLDDYAGQTVKNAPGTPSHDTLQGNIGEVEVPRSVVIPEPVTWLVMGIGLLSVGLIRRRCSG